MNRLKLDTNIDRPDFDLVIEKTNSLNQLKGIPMSITGLKALNYWLDVSLTYITRYINILAGRNPDAFIDMTSRTDGANHITNIISKYYYKNYNVDWIDSEFYTDKGYRTTKLSVLNRVKELLEYQQLPTEMIDAMLLYQTHSYTRTNNMRYFKDTYILSEDSKDEIAYIHPILEMVSTGRLSTNSPNVQGWVNTVKKQIKAPKGYKIMSMDIAGQDAHILVWGIMDNKSLKEGYLKYSDAYNAFLHAAGMPILKTLRKMVKVPVLALMNGMSYRGIQANLKEAYDNLSKDDRAEVDSHGGYQHIGSTIYNMVNNDSGYKRIVKAYSDLHQDPNIMRKGLFGTKLPVKTSGSVRNQLKNGFFQVTAAEILVLSLMIMNSMIEHNLKNGYDDIRLLVPIYDEVVFIVKDELVDQAKDMIENIMKPIVDDWAPFQGEIMVGQHYMDGESNKIITLNDLLNLDTNGSEVLLQDQETLKECAKQVEPYLEI